MQNLIYFNKSFFEKYNLLPTIHAPRLVLMPHLRKNGSQNLKPIDAHALIC